MEERTYLRQVSAADGGDDVVDTAEKGRRGELGRAGGTSVNE